MFHRYPDSYWESCFEAWYSAGCPKRYSVIHDVIPAYSDGTKPSIHTLKSEIPERLWYQRADELDAEASRRRKESLISEKVEMLNRQAEHAREIQIMALEKLRTDGFDTSASAVQAFIRASELERVSRGIGDTLKKLSTMSDEELIMEVKKLASGIIDAEIVADGDSDDGSDGGSDDDSEDSSESGFDEFGGED